MNKYEISVIFNPNLDEATLKAEYERVEKYIARFGGEIEKVDEWGKRRLAYEIQKINEGYYYILNVSAIPSFPKELESRLRIMESVLRYLIIRVDPN